MSNLSHMFGLIYKRLSAVTTRNTSRKCHQMRNEKLNKSFLYALFMLSYILNTACLNYWSLIWNRFSRFLNNFFWLFYILLFWLFFFEISTPRNKICFLTEALRHQPNLRTSSVERTWRRATEMGLTSAREDSERHLRRVSRRSRAVHHWCLLARLRSLQSRPKRCAALLCPARLLSPQMFTSCDVRQAHCVI